MYLIIIIIIIIIIIKITTASVNLRFFPIDGRSLYHLIKLLLMDDVRWQGRVGLSSVGAFSQVHKRWQHSVSFVSVIPESSNGPNKRGLYKALEGR